MKYLLLLVYVCLVCVAVTQVAGAAVDSEDVVNVTPRRQGRLFSSLNRWLGPWGPGQGTGGGCGHPDTCPVHHCRFDDAVIHGYCCGCARVTDRVPIQCPIGLRCPPTPHPLCDDYDYLMECCC